MSALSDALAQAQRSAIAAIGRTYVHQEWGAQLPAVPHGSAPPTVCV